MSANRKTINLKTVTIFPQSFYIRWLDERFDKKYESVTDLKDGFTYLKLLRKLFPADVDVEPLSGSPMRNWKNLDYYFGELHVVKTINFEELLSDNEKEHWYFLAWFKTFYEINESKRQKHDYLMHWVRVESCMKADTLKDLSDAIIYSILVRKLYPKAIDMTRLQTSGCSTEECRRRNLKVLHESFERVHAKTVVPIDGLSKLHPETCFEFLIIFKDFYDRRSDFRQSKVALQRQNAEMMMRILEAATQVEGAFKGYNSRAKAYIIAMGKSIGALKGTNSVADGLVVVMRERYANIATKPQQSYLIYKTKPLNHYHDLFDVAKVLMTMHRANPEVISSEINDVAHDIIYYFNSLREFLFTIICETHDALMDIQVHHQHKLKDMFYIMKYKFMNAKKLAEEIKTMTTRGSNGNMTLIIYQLLEATEMAVKIKDHVDFMHRKTK